MKNALQYLICCLVFVVTTLIYLYDKKSNKIYSQKIISSENFQDVHIKQNFTQNCNEYSSIKVQEDFQLFL